MINVVPFGLRKRKMDTRGFEPRTIHKQTDSVRSEYHTPRPYAQSVNIEVVAYLIIYSQHNVTQGMEELVGCVRHQGHGDSEPYLSRYQSSAQNFVNEVMRNTQAHRQRHAPLRSQMDSSG